MNKTLVTLDIDVVYNGVDYRKKLIEPIDEILGDTGKTMFSIPGIYIDEAGEEKFQRVSLDIKIVDFEAISLLEQFLKKNGLLEKSRLSFYSNKYNLLDIFVSTNRNS